jgi:hypothetical protein
MLRFKQGHHPMPRKNKRKEIDYAYDSENSDVQHDSPEREVICEYR